jgi:ubiquitin-conjugating enzyme E2 M
MIKLRELQQKQQAAKTGETPASSNGDKMDTENTTPQAEKQGEEFNLPRKSSKELGDLRDKKKNSKDNVFGSNKRRGRRGRGGNNAAELRAQKDISEMDLDALPGIKVEFPDPNNIMTFKVYIKPSDGLYKSAEYLFNLVIPASYPYDPPTVTCETLVYHPNIDWNGRVCLNILRADWKPVLTLGSVFFGLMTLFLEPNPDDPLNKEAAELMIKNKVEFERNVKQSLKGGNFLGHQFPKLL